MRKIVLIIIYSFIGATNYSQNLILKRNHLIDYLFYSKAELQDVNSNHEKSLYLAKLPAQDKSLQYDRQIFIKYKNHFYLLLEGTGRVYQATNISDSAISFQRLDSTQYAGYNFLSINFCYRDTLFSLGGYGFWKFNGQLRYFSNHQWSLMPTNKEIGLINHLSYIDFKESKIFTITQDFHNEAEISTKITTIPTKLILTDLPKKRNDILGEINPYIGNIFADSYILWKSSQLNGIVIAYNQSVYLINFQKNRIYRANTGKISDNLMSNIQYKPGYIFQSADTVYYVKNTDKENLFFFTVSANDFDKEGIPLYINIKTAESAFFMPVIILVIFLISITIIWHDYKKRNQSIETSLINKKDDFLPNSISQIDPTFFSVFEMQIIEIIIRENLVTVDTINRILGLSKKSLEIQKKSRNDVIHRINHKFKILCDVETDLIERVRSDEDKRFLKYQVNEANQKIYMEYKKKQA